MTDIANTSPEVYTSPFTYEYKITGLKVKDEGANANAVVQTYWTLTGTDNENNSGTFTGATPFTSTTMPEGDVFVPLAVTFRTLACVSMPPR